MSWLRTLLLIVTIFLSIASGATSAIEVHAESPVTTVNQCDDSCPDTAPNAAHAAHHSHEALKLADATAVGLRAVEARIWAIRLTTILPLAPAVRLDRPPRTEVC